MKIYIKNMACQSCIILLKQALNDLDIPTMGIELGQIETQESITDDKKAQLNIILRKAGMELLEKKQDVLIGKIKDYLIKSISDTDVNQSIKLSVLISEEFSLSYKYLSNIFSEIECTTIEQYVIALKTEKIKELIIYGEDTFSEIAYQLNYCSVGHLSKQFKKTTGLTPSHYKALKEKRRITIESL